MENIMEDINIFFAWCLTKILQNRTLITKKTAYSDLKFYKTAITMIKFEYSDYSLLITSFSSLFEGNIYMQ